MPIKSRTRRPTRKRPSECRSWEKRVRTPCHARIIVLAGRRRSAVSRSSANGSDPIIAFRKAMARRRRMKPRELSTSNLNLFMAHPISLEIPPHDGSVELENRLKRAQVQHGEALLAGIQVLQALHDRGVLDTLVGALGSAD